eukprot:Sspe_Gene.67542::Locus_39849_Transcript_1_1_Confidence_1.000_Length_1925::g.67542::m.67542
MAQKNELADLHSAFEEATQAQDEVRSRPKVGAVVEHDVRYTPIRHDLAQRVLLERDDWERFRGAGSKLQKHLGCFASLFHTHLKSTLEDERDLVFALTTNASGRDHVAFSWDDETHCRIASTVFKKLMDRAPNTAVMPTGDHWLSLGFQGPNFLSDAGRLGGVFVMLQMLAFIDKAPRLAFRTFRESRPPSSRSFSWALWSLCWSTRTIDAFEKNKLTKAINAKGSVWEVLHDFYIGLFAECFDRWTEKEVREEMHDFNEIKMGVTKWAMDNPAAVLKKCAVALKASKDNVAVKATDNVGDLTNLADL